jgi:hypothetical protein
MRTILLLSLLAAANASWFGKDAKDYSQEQYQHAQKVFADKQHDVIKSWDDSQLRKFLVAQGVVDPSGPRESLEALARSQYASYTSFASAASSTASSILYGGKSEQASKSATSLAHKASSSGASAASEASASASSYAAQASTEVARKADSTRDYIYANWSDSELRGFLQKKGIIAKEKSTREQLLDQVKNSYDYVWESWTDSYIVSFNSLLSLSPPNHLDVARMARRTQPHPLRGAETARRVYQDDEELLLRRQLLRLGHVV